VENIFWSDTAIHRTRCLPLEPGILLTMLKAQSQHWGSNPQLWLN
jgi:hypothetical protein